jgi:tape measure domain-containing protein
VAEYGGKVEVQISLLGIDVTMRQLKKFERQTLVTTEKMKRGFEGANAAINGMSRALAPLAALAGGVGFASLVYQITEIGKQSQNAGRQLQFLTAEYNETAQATEAVARVSAVLNISSLEATKGLSKLYGALRPTGLELQQIEVLFVGFTKAALRGGATTAEAASGIMQLKQAFSAGRLTGDELRSTLENLPGAAVEIARAFDTVNGTSGTTVGQLKELGGQGKLTTDVLFEAAKSLAALDIAAPTDVEGLSKAFENFAENVAKAVGPAIAEGLAGLAAGITYLSEVFAENRDTIVSTIKQVGNFIGVALKLVAAIKIVTGVIALWRLRTLALAKAKALLQAFSGPAGWASLAAGAAAYAGISAAIGKAGKEISKTADKIGEKNKKLKQDFKDMLGTVNSPPSTTNTALAKSAEELKVVNAELKRSEALAMEQAKGIYGPSTLKVMASRVKLAQAERAAQEANAKLRATNKKDKNFSKLDAAAKDAANASLIAAEEAARILKEAYKEAKETALSAADALGKAKTDRASQLFGDGGINQYLDPGQKRGRQAAGVELQKQEFRKIQAELAKSLGGTAGQKIAGLRVSGGSQESQFALRQKFIENAREELYGQKALVTAQQDLTKAITDLNTTVAKGGDSVLAKSNEKLIESITGLTNKDWGVKVDAQITDGTIQIQNALS